MQIPTSAKNLFDDLLPLMLKQHADRAAQVGGIYGFRLMGEGGGEWTADLDAKEPNVCKGIQLSARCTIQLDHSDFMLLLKDPTMAMKLFFSGKLRVEGDPMLAMKLQKLFSFAREQK